MSSKQQLATVGLCFLSQTAELAPADGRLYSLRDVTATVESIPLIASSIMSKKLAEGVDALVLDVKVGNGAFMKRQVDARRLAQMMVGIGRRMDKRVQALITDMNQPLGYAVGNALEVMEASQTLQNAGPADLTRLCIELAARMIFVAKISRYARRGAPARREEAGGWLRLPEVQAGWSQRRAAMRRRSTSSNCCPTPPACAKSCRPARGYVSVINAEDIGLASNMIGAGRDRKEDAIDPAVGVILEVKVGEKVEAGSRALPPLLHQGRSRGRSCRNGRGRLPHLRAAPRRPRADPGSRKLMSMWGRRPHLRRVSRPAHK